jgi:hypothetical protein
MSRSCTQDVINICPDDSIDDNRGDVSTMDNTIMTTAFRRMTAAVMTKVVMSYTVIVLLLVLL